MSSSNPFPSSPQQQQSKRHLWLAGTSATALTAVLAISAAFSA